MGGERRRGEVGDLLEKAAFSFSFFFHFSSFPLFLFLFFFFFFFFFFPFLFLLSHRVVGWVALRRDWKREMQNKPAEELPWYGRGTHGFGSLLWTHPELSRGVNPTLHCEEEDQDTASAWPRARGATGEGQLRNTSQLFTLFLCLLD